MKASEIYVKKPPLKKDSFSLQAKENRVMQVNNDRKKIYVETSVRKDESFSSYKGLSSSSNRSNESGSRASSRESKRSNSRDRSTENRSNILTKKSSVSSLREDPSVLAQITNFEKDIVHRGVKVPSVTAKAWVVADGDTGEVIFGRREATKREVASITKIMTCYCACKLIQSYDIDSAETYIQVSQNASKLTGTSANLKAGDIISIWDLLHGLMLPSGNDAAYCIAESFGMYIQMQSEDYKAKVKENPAYAQSRNKFALKYFLQYMNQTAQDLELTGTNYSNPHGLCDKNNRSTAADIAKLTATAMRNDLFRQVVIKQKYTSLIEQSDGVERKSTWENTNKLLPEGWQGVKTGITTAAGPCFSGYFKLEGVNYIVVVLSCESMDIRWTECKKLVNWVHTQSKLL